MTTIARKASSAAPAPNGLLATLAGIPIGRRRTERRPAKIPLSVLAFVLRNLATLLGTGVPLTKSLSTLMQEQSLKKYRGLLESARRSVAAGNTFSSALLEFSTTFNEVMVNQIRAGERAGTLAATLDQIARQLEQSANVRSQILRKLAYPATLLVGGSAAISFLLIFVVPLFQKTYDEIGIPLPWITRALMAAGRGLASYGWLALLGLVGLPVTLRWARRNPATALATDTLLLELPLFGHWLRGIAVLQFIEVFGNLIESGFTVAEALRISARVVRNRVVRKGIEDLQAAVMRGERFSRELDRHSGLFPPVASQLIMIGEQTGNLRGVAAHIRDHLRRETERYTVVLVGILEPVLTISLAAIIACVLLAIYLPMFDMIGSSRVH